MFGRFRLSGFAVAVGAVLIATVIICICAVSCSGGKLTFESTYYYICYRITDNSVSASSLSDTVSSYGGAGYVMAYSGNYYVTVSCYYTLTDAETVCESLKKRDLNCSVITVETETYKLNGRYAKQNSSLYLGNLNTLYSLSLLAYECANGLDTGEYNQSKAKDVVAAVKSGLKGLLNYNASNCFTNKINMLIAECTDRESGYLLSKDMRYLQIAITDVIVNVELS